MKSKKDNPFKEVIENISALLSPRKMTELIPITQYLDDVDCFKLKEGNLDLLEINTKDLFNCSEEEIEYDVIKFARLYKTYKDDLKIVAMNFPCSTSQQQKYIQRKINNTTNIVLKERLMIKLHDLQEVERKCTAKEYYLFVFSQNEQDHYLNKGQILQAMENGRERMISEMPKEKKINILFKINNMLTSI